MANRQTPETIIFLTVVFLRSLQRQKVLSLDNYIEAFHLFLNIQLHVD